MSLRVVAKQSLLLKLLRRFTPRNDKSFSSLRTHSRSLYWVERSGQCKLWSIPSFCHSEAIPIPLFLSFRKRGNLFEIPHCSFASPFAKTWCSSFAEFTLRYRRPQDFGSDSFIPHRRSVLENTDRRLVCYPCWIGWTFLFSIKKWLENYAYRYVVVLYGVNNILVPHIQ